MTEVEAVLAAGLAAHQAGRLDEAEASYRRALAAEPDHPQALHLLAVAALQRGRTDLALELARRATDVMPVQATFWNTRGIAERASGQIEEAAASFRQAVTFDPDYADGWDNLAVNAEALGDRAGEATALERLTALRPDHARAWGRRGVLAYQTDQLDRAGEYFAEATRLAPGDADAWTNLGAVQLRQGQMDAAEQSQRRAIALRPASVVARNNLGNVLVARSRWAEAATVLAPVVQEAPGDANGWLNFGHALKGLERYEAAQEAYARALTLRPGDLAALVGLADALQGQGELSLAIQAYEQALAVRPGDPDTHEHVGVAYQRLGQLERAAAAFRAALALDPDRPTTHSFLIVVLDLQEGAEADAFEERRCWSARFVRPHDATRRPHANTPDPDRPLRIGYVSADFKHHSAAYAVLPVLRSHDHTRFQVVCYSGVSSPDHVTAEIRSLADRWHDVAYLSDDELARLVRDDQIDILVDLSGHSGGNRLPMFGRKPAPVQVTAWGYAASTGLDTVDYLLADPVAIPPEASTGYVEQIAYLPSFLCYTPPTYAPEVTSLPSLERGYVTFGAFNRLPKVSAGALAAWAGVLTAVPGSRLTIKCDGADVTPGREWLLGQLAAHGVEADRITLLGSTPHPEHLAAYGEIDAMLDTFPQSGGITTLDALLMGVPVVTLLGERIAGRASASMLTTLGLQDLVAHTADEYVSIAARLAADSARLRHERTTLRARLLASPMADAATYTQAVEAVYREIWRRWARRQETGDRRQEAGEGELDGDCTSHSLVGAQFIAPQFIAPQFIAPTDGEGTSGAKERP